MAETANDSAFWLPSDFLSDDDLFYPPKLNINPSGTKGFTLRPPPPQPAGFPLFRRSSSALTSPGESVVSSTETESSDDPDEFIAELTRHLARSALRDHHEKSWGVLATSPQSTLTGFPTSTNRRSGGAIMTPPAYGDDEAWELIYAAAERMAKFRMSCQAQMMKQQQMRGFLGASEARTPPVCYNAPQNHQFQQQIKNHQVKSSWLAQQQMPRNRGGLFECASGRCGGHPNNSSFPALRAQQQPSNPHRHLNHACGGAATAAGGMRAVYLGGGGGAGIKKQSTGTGVFLPRRAGDNNNKKINNPPTEPRKKQGCSTVLLPARVVQALNLNIDEMNAHAHTHTHPPNHDILVGRRNGVLMMGQQQQRRGLRGGEGHEVPLLPQEWTY